MADQEPADDAALTVISSMATKALLAELAAPHGASVESVGGVDAARRVAAGETFDAMVLAGDAIDRLIASGHALAPRVDLVSSAVAVAVRAGAPLPNIDDESALRDAVLAAASIGYSTGPSGTQLLQLFERWSLADELRPRLRQAPPGVPVGSLVADGSVALGFQQLSELATLPGIAVVGTLPPAAAIVTTFSGAVAASSRRPERARQLLAAWAAPSAAAVKQRHGMSPA